MDNDSSLTGLAYKWAETLRHLSTLSKHSGNMSQFVLDDHDFFKKMFWDDKFYRYPIRRITGVHSTRRQERALIKL